jgi:hypothetical protein
MAFPKVQEGLRRPRQMTLKRRNIIGLIIIRHKISCRGGMAARYHIKYNLCPMGFKKGNNVANDFFSKTM